MPRDRRAVIGTLDGPTWVYEARCEHSGLLYVGVARDVQRRVKKHRTTKPWWRTDVADVTAFLYPTRRQALDVEAHEIFTFSPLHNIAGQAACNEWPADHVPPHHYTDLAVLNARGARL